MTESAREKPAREEGLTEAQWEAAGEALLSRDRFGVPVDWAALDDETRTAWEMDARDIDDALRRRGLCIAPSTERTATDE